MASYAPPAQMFVFGAIDFSASLVRVGKVLGYRVTVCDAPADFRHGEAIPQKQMTWSSISPTGGWRLKMSTSAPSSPS